MFKKIIEAGTETQKKFLKGIAVVDKMVGDTLGHGGRNRLIQRKYKAPLVTNDGATIARHILIEDPIEDMAAQTIIEISMETANQAGDGTTTSAVMATTLAREHIQKQIENANSDVLDSGDKINALETWRQINVEKDRAIEYLKEMSRELTDEDIHNVISTSLENMEYGETLAELFKKIGKDGYISVEENWATKKGIDTETIEGMRFYGKYASPYLITTANKKEALWTDAHILVTNQRVDDFGKVEKVFKELMATPNKKLVIIGGYSEGETPFSKEFIRKISAHMKGFYQLDAEKQASVGQILLIQAPSLTTQELEDVAVFCDAKLYDKNLNMDIRGISINELGYVSKVSATEEEVNLIGGRGNVAERIEVLKAQAELEKDEMFRQKMLRRIASLASGVGIIRVGASTESERSYIKYKLEDAVLALKAAHEEGIVQGGGLAYSELAERLGEDSLLYSMLKAPHERIKSNLGVETLDVPESIVDPTKVVRIAIQNACSGAGMLITSDGAIADVKLTFADFFEKAIAKAMPMDWKNDWRDSENQDAGAGRFID